MNVINGEALYQLVTQAHGSWEVCSDGREFLLSQSSKSAAWENCPKASWMIRLLNILYGGHAMVPKFSTSVHKRMDKMWDELSSAGYAMSPRPSWFTFNWDNIHIVYDKQAAAIVRKHFPRVPRLNRR